MKIGLMALASFACATAALSVSPASAASGDNPLARDQVLLDLSGLDLATADGQQRLAIRMDQAANAVCGDRVATIHLALESKARECRAAVMADIRTRIEARTAQATVASPVQFASAN